ncbi:MAG: flavodoxin domain-containing protein [Acholeplasmatales bacterium]|nr:flavodoxin domain-containing protein [Acholeplasmatales bacterium]
MNGIIIYWSETGNTESMALRISDDTKFEAKRVEDVNVLDVLKYDNIVLGCPAMGAEELEETTFRPFFDKLLEKVDNQKLFLFGSWGWGGGEYMSLWEDEVKNSGKNLGCKGICGNGDASSFDEDEYDAFLNAINN